MESEGEVSSGKQSPKRSVTSLTLGWIAERLRRAERLKKEVESGSYRVNSAAVAQAIVGTKNDSG